ncbi:hypothetical protein FACS1894199_02910 [Bacteroidia bacterium]|nr:hypothetical protein FACS1894199_02910 [Bacteroidia bacterium]
MNNILKRKNMKTKRMMTVVATVATVVACTTEDYYRSANESSTLSSTVDLNVVDTIKTSAISAQRTYVLPITGEDVNGNMNLLTVSATGGNAVIMVDGTPTEEAIELSKERFKFNRSIEFSPIQDGKHTITAKIRDDFGNTTLLEKEVYSFTNMRPKVVCTIDRERPSGNTENIRAFFDYRNSFDRDAKWGGQIDSLYYVSWCQPYYDDNPGAPYDDAHWPCVWPAMHPNDFSEDFTMNLEPFYDDGVYWVTDVYIWVKDNEGAVSDTLHITGLGHVD